MRSTTRLSSVAGRAGQLVVLAFVWAELSPSRIMARHPVLLLWALGLLFSKTVTQAPVCARRRPRSCNVADG